MRKFTEELHQRIQTDIQKAAALGEVGFEYYSSCYSITKAAMGELKAYVYNIGLRTRKRRSGFSKK